jgi:predicted phage terminase large subunit-like protein
VTTTRKKKTNTNTNSNQLTPQQLLQVKGELLKRDLKSFIKSFWHVTEPATPFIDGLHIDAICDHLTSIDEIQNLLICVPPGFAKSLLGSVHFFCWRWLTHAHERFIYASHSLDLATRDSRKCRSIIGSPLYQQLYGDLFQISVDQDTKVRFDNSKSGFRLCSSVDGHVTGERADFVVCDDPHNIKEIDSVAKREAVINWYATAFSNRVVPQKHQRLVIMQMCHHDDLANSIIKNDKANAWTKLIVPLESGKSKYQSTRWVDPRCEGEFLCPLLFSPEKAQEQKQQSGKRAFECQYNQNPAPSEDAIFQLHNLKYYTELPECGGIRIASVDLAISTSNTADYTVILIADVHHDGKIYLVHMHRVRINGAKIVPTIKALYQEYRPQVVYVEDVAFQRLVIEEARNQGVPVRPVRPEGSKESRSVLTQVKLENSQLYVPENKEWATTLIKEMEDFPSAPHDDCVDALSMISIGANQIYRKLAPPTPPKLSPDEERRKKEDELKRLAEEHARLVAQDESEYRKRFFAGL